MDKPVFEDDQNFFKSHELNEHGQMDLIKAKGKKDPIGTVRSGMKKIAEGKWIKTKNQSIRQAGDWAKTEKALKEMYKENNPATSFDNWKKQLKDPTATANTYINSKASSINDIKIGNKTFKLNITTKENKTVSTISDDKGTTYNSKPGEDVNKFKERVKKQIEGDFGGTNKLNAEQADKILKRTYKIINPPSYPTFESWKRGLKDPIAAAKDYQRMNKI